MHRLTSTPQPLPTVGAFLSDAARRDIDEALADLLARRIEAAIARTDAMLRRRHATPAACPSCGYRLSNGYTFERDHRPDTPAIERSRHHGQILSVR